jgi:hypothetical protein
MKMPSYAALRFALFAYGEGSNSFAFKSLNCFTLFLIQVRQFIEMVSGSDSVEDATLPSLNGSSDNDNFMEADDGDDDDGVDDFQDPIEHNEDEEMTNGMYKTISEFS